MIYSYGADQKKLDNPAWYSLTETHEALAIHYNGVKFYHPEYCPFGGFIHVDGTQEALDKYSLDTNNFYLIGDRPNYSGKLELIKELVCNQMLLVNPKTIYITEQIIHLKTIQQKNHLTDLVNLVQPGYFKSKTPLMGSYYGIYKGNILVAVSGERMKMNGYTEVSAVVTHPCHTGKGYAKQLVAYTSKKIFSENKIPYLHVAANNEAAISLYQKLGFQTRRKISFWNFETGITGFCLD